MARYNAEFGTNLTPALVTKWDAMVSLTHFRSIAEFWEWTRNGSGPGLFRNLPIFTDAKPALDRLSRNHDIVILTTKPPWANAETFSWIGEHAIPTREVHIIGDKWRVECDVYLDDGPHNLESLVSERPDRIVCRFIRPWNDAVPGVIDIDDWDTFEALVDRL